MITGADGRIAQSVIRHFSHLDGVELFLFSRHPDRLPALENAGCQSVEMTDFHSLRCLLTEINPDRIIHTAAMTRPDECEKFPDRCEQVNVDTVRILAKHCQTHGTHITFLSSDFVFDGQQGPYDEAAETHPLNRYGQSKLRAEQILQSANIPCSILRGSFMYGRCPYFERPDLFERVRSKLSNGEIFQAPYDQFRAPTLAEDFAQTVCFASQHHSQGLFHVASNTVLSIYEMVHRFAASAGLDPSKVIPVATETLRETTVRPLKTGFIITKSLREFGLEPRSFEAGLLKLNGPHNQPNSISQ